MTEDDVSKLDLSDETWALINKLIPVIEQFFRERDPEGTRRQREEWRQHG